MIPLLPVDDNDAAVVFSIAGLLLLLLLPDFGGSAGVNPMFEVGGFVTVDVDVDVDEDDVDVVND